MDVNLLPSPSFDSARLPAPSSVNEADLTAVIRSDTWRNGGILRQRVADATINVREWVLSYERAHGAVLAVIRQHFLEFGTRPFDWTPPAGSAALRVMHREPPAIDWDSETSGTARIFLEEVPAH